MGKPSLAPKEKIRSKEKKMDESLRFEEISDHVGIPLESLYDLQKQGLAPIAIKVGNTFRVQISDYANWLALHRVPMR